MNKPNLFRSKANLAERLLEDLSSKPLTLSDSLELQREMAFYIETLRNRSIPRIDALISRLENRQWEFLSLPEVEPKKE